MTQSGGSPALKKTPSFARIGALVASKCGFHRRGPGWWTAKRPKKERAVHQKKVEVVSLPKLVQLYSLFQKVLSVELQCTGVWTKNPTTRLLYSTIILTHICVNSRIAVNVLLLRLGNGTISAWLHFANADVPSQA